MPVHVTPPCHAWLGHLEGGVDHAEHHMLGHIGYLVTWSPVHARSQFWQVTAWSHVSPPGHLCHCLVTCVTDRLHRSLPGHMCHQRVTYVTFRSHRSPGYLVACACPSPGYYRVTQVTAWSHVSPACQVVCRSHLSPADHICHCLVTWSPGYIVICVNSGHICDPLSDQGTLAGHLVTRM